MKNKFVVGAIAVSAFLLASCNNINNKKSNDVSLTPSTTFINSTEINSVSSQQYNESRSLSLYAINDFHGAVIQNDNEPGIEALGGYLKERKAEGNTLLLNSGDMWQGSIESNYNHGRLLTEAMNEIGFDCFTLGNHEFDWGQEFIQFNRELSDTTINNGYQTPFLAANIYDFDIENKITFDYAELGDEYVIKTLENGLKVGIIGVIGKDQITSICSQYVDDISFEAPTPIIKNLSDKLRQEENCDVIILDTHTDQRSITESNDLGQDFAGITQISKITNKRYVDAVFCAHTHQNETDYINGVPFIQTNGYGRSVSNVELEVSSKGDVTCKKYYNISSNTFRNYKDENLANLVQKYKDNSDEVSNEKIGYTYGNMSSNEILPNFVTVAMANFAETNNIPIDYALTNNARSILPYGNVTYGTLYHSLPFDNVIYVIKTRGTYLARELNYSSTSFYRIDDEPIDENKIYQIAVIDYMAFHRNTNRNYNYFPDLEVVCKFEKNGYEIYNYRDLTADYMRSFNGATIQSSNYSDSQIRHNSSLIHESIG